MDEKLPHLFFPEAEKISPRHRTGVPQNGGKFQYPDSQRQNQLLSSKLDRFNKDFIQYKASISSHIGGFEPERVLVLEIAGSAKELQRAVEKTEGLEWVGEYLVDDMKPDDNFYEEDSNGDRLKEMRGQMFLSFVNERGIEELIKLRKHWEQDQKLPHGQGQWKEVFPYIKTIRRWGIQEILTNTKIVDYWKELESISSTKNEIYCQIELFYRKSENKRKENELCIESLVKDIDGQLISDFYQLPEIAFHAVKVKFPSERLQNFKDAVESPELEMIELLKFPSLMFIYPSGQSLSDNTENTVEQADSIVLPKAVGSPVAAVLDGVPNLNNKYLSDGRILLDDPDDISSEYQPGMRLHGTFMASLVLYGELDVKEPIPVNSPIYYVPIMQPDAEAEEFEYFREHVPKEVFFEDRIWRAVRRMFEGEGEIPALAPSVKIVNLSICDPERPFTFIPSPAARLLDWLSWKYKILFCVSAGNYEDSIDIGVPVSEFNNLSDLKKVQSVIGGIEKQMHVRRILSPAESLNSLTIGAIHTDKSEPKSHGQNVDILPKLSHGQLPKFAEESYIFSPISRIGFGFRRSMKPEILFPGGKQLYESSLAEQDTTFSLKKSGGGPPGLRVASDDEFEGGLESVAYTRSTSGATALATRSGIKIHEMLMNLTAKNQIPDDQVAVLLKTLLVHGANYQSLDIETIGKSLNNAPDSRKVKEYYSRFVGYGAVDIDRVLASTSQRATVIGYGYIGTDFDHVYRLPIPRDLSGRSIWRRVTITLAWISPINSQHRNLREAKLKFYIEGQWKDTILRVKRNSFDHHQVLRGTVQHEIFEDKNQISEFQRGKYLPINICCQADATTKLDSKIPYGLAITLEVNEDKNLPIYEQIRGELGSLVVVEA